jgi:hypothetical protein
MFEEQETYVLGDIEVKKTGRTATKQMGFGPPAILVEVTPVDENDGNWKKWVAPGALFTIDKEK